jgi:hypothetical protein
LKTIGRHAAAIVCGLLVMLGGQFLADLFGLWAFPLPPGMKIGVTPMPEILASRPLGAVLLYNVLRLPILALSGAMIARIAPSHPKRDVLIAVVPYIALSLLATVRAGAPMWIHIWVIVLFPVCALVGASQMLKRRATALQ